MQTVGALSCKQDEMEDGDESEFEKSDCPDEEIAVQRKNLKVLKAQKKPLRNVT